MARILSPSRLSSLNLIHVLAPQQCRPSSVSRIGPVGSPPEGGGFFNQHYGDFCISRDTIHHWLVKTCIKSPHGEKQECVDSRRDELNLRGFSHWHHLKCTISRNHSTLMIASGSDTTCCRGGCGMMIRKRRREPTDGKRIVFPPSTRALQLRPSTCTARRTRS